MARVVRRRRIAAAPVDAWQVVSDPDHLPRWWPETQRVENVTGAGESLSWTQVLGTRKGRGVRADYRCTSFDEPERFGFAQSLAGSPFEKHLRMLEIEITLRAAEGGTEVSVERNISLRGLSRFGSPMMSRGGGRILDKALSGLDEIFGGSGDA